MYGIGRHGTVEGVWHLHAKERARSPNARNTPASGLRPHDQDHPCTDGRPERNDMEKTCGPHWYRRTGPHYLHANTWNDPRSSNNWANRSLPWYFVRARCPVRTPDRRSSSSRMCCRTSRISVPWWPTCTGCTIRWMRVWWANVPSWNNSPPTCVPWPPSWTPHPSDRPTANADWPPHAEAPKALRTAYTIPPMPTITNPETVHNGCAMSRLMQNAAAQSTYSAGIQG